MINDEPLVIGIVAGEVSGDRLGADFMRQMNELSDNIRWVGVGGSQMQEQGLESLFDMSRLAVMGLVEVLKHLPDLFKARAELLKEFMLEEIDCFIGIDAPDFNLRVAKKLKPKGIFCVQYVSPSVWAWRESRIHSIMNATDLVLCLFPFELPVYEKYGHSAVCVGHPLLHSIDKNLLNLPTSDRRRDFINQSPSILECFASFERRISHIICVMPGSRMGEVNAILPLMLDSIDELLSYDSELCFIIPAVSESLKVHMQSMIDEHKDRVKNAVGVIYNETEANFSQQLMAFSDLVLLASGTATLEAMLLNRPMVVVYKLNSLTYFIAKMMVKVPYVSLPNILADDELVPELIQDEANPNNVARGVWQTLNTQAYQEQVENLQEASKRLYLESSQNPVHAFIEHFTLNK